MAALKILIVEDEVTSRLLLSSFLSPLGPCDEAEDGREAVQKFRSALQDGAPYDLVCLDIMMPRMDGQAALREIREAEDAAGIIPDQRTKVLMVTALSEQHHVLRAYMRGGATGYLVKPIDKERLYAELGKLGFRFL